MLVETAQAVATDNNEAASTFARNLSEVCRRRGVTKRELSRLSGVHVATIQRIVAGQNCPTLETAERLAGALGYRLGRIFTQRLD